MALPLIAELNRRRIFRALIGYGIGAFALLQIIEPVMHGLHWPDVVLSYAVVILAFGFPVVVTLAWIFDVNAGKIERTPVQPNTPAIPRGKTAIVLVGIGMLAAAPGLSWYFFWRGRTPSAGTTASVYRLPASIAVLPFADMSQTKDQEYLSDGIAEEILNSLAQLDGLRVIGRTSSFSFKGQNKDLRAIGDTLGVANLLEGSVRSSGRRIRITVQLVEATGGSHLWSQTYDRDMTDIFAVQEEVATAVANALKLKLVEDRGTGSKERRTTAPEVVNQYLLGKQFARRSSGSASAEDNQNAIQAYEKALSLDPSYAPAWAALALARMDRANDYSASVIEWTTTSDRALEAAEKSVALDPALADAYHARGRIRTVYKWDWSGARADLERGLAINPGHAALLTAYGHLLYFVGRLPEAVAVVQKSAQLDPLDPLTWWSLGVKRLVNGEPELSRGAFRRTLEIAPDHQDALAWIGVAALLEGKPASALESFRRCPKWRRLTGTAIAEHSLGHSHESQEALADLIEMPFVSYQVAEVHAWRGERDKALDWLERAYAERDGGLLGMIYDPLVRSLHKEPRYKALLRKMNLPEEEPLARRD
jgi:TolB-like protein/tetratricopeptide (TPR) repeat protein